MRTVIAGGTVVTAVDCFCADVQIENGVVSAIGKITCQPGDRVIDAQGCYLFPGGIDPHTHFDLPVGSITTADDFYTGSRAAIAGGTTSVIDFATQSKGGSLAEALTVWHHKAQGRSYVDYGFHMAISDWHSGIIPELMALPEAGVTSVKLYMAYKNVLQVDDAALLQAFQACKKAGFLVCLHCENGDVIAVLVEEARRQGHYAPRYHAATRPVLAEREAVFRALCMAELSASPLYVVHVSSGAALDVIREGRKRGLPVYAETCPQYLVLDESSYQTDDFSAAKYVISPPLRPKENQDILWKGLGSGLVDTVGSDHCSFNLAGHKDLGRGDFSLIPNGAPGVENRFGLLYTYGVAAGKINLTTFVAVVSTNAAKLFGLYPRKGTIAVGSDADIVVWDPTVHSTIQAVRQYQNVDYNAYEGFMQAGMIRHVLLRGRQVVVEGVLADQPPQGQFIFRTRKGSG
jgi:dihydropyrimidinase